MTSETAPAPDSLFTSLAQSTRSSAGPTTGGPGVIAAYTPSTTTRTSTPRYPFSTPPPFSIPPSLRPSRSSTPHPPSIRGTNMGKDKEKSNIDIILDAPYLSLRGTGPDVEPTILSGHVLLYLSEATDIKEITLHFRGKARIPLPATDSLLANNTPQTYTFCEHDWSFLEGSKGHTRTLKSGRHIFPFSLTITGDLPSTLTTHPLSLSSGLSSTRGSISYKLRAVASRPGLSLGPGPLHNVHMPIPQGMHNLVHITPVHLMRTFTPEALEYQQSLEIENTWPEKLMYSIMLPHKAWAAGDTLVGVLKFSPLHKGVKVESVITALWEQTRVYTKHGAQEDKRIVKCMKHRIAGNGKAVEVDLISRKCRGLATGGSSTSSDFGQRTFGAADSNSSGPSTPMFPDSDDSQEEDDGPENNDVVTFIKFPIPQTTNSLPTPSSSSNLHSSSSSTNPSPSASTPGFTPATTSAGGVFVPTSSSVGTTITPSHTLEPIVVTHRIRWSIFIRNRDGHTSELRCSLPVYIMDGKLLEESRACSIITRRMVLQSIGFNFADGPQGDEGEDSMEGNFLPEADGEDRELPSYHAHVRDRVANMYLPEAATVRVPWAGFAGGESVESPGADHSEEPIHLARIPYSQGSGSGRDSPVNLAASETSPLEWINLELLASLAEDPSAGSGADANGGASGSQSRAASRPQSRSGSPEREIGGHSGASSSSSSAMPSSTYLADGHSGQGHGHHHHVKHLSNLFKAKMKPFTTLGHHGHGHSHGQGHGHGHGFFGMSRGMSSISGDHDIDQPSSSVSSPGISRPPSPSSTAPSTATSQSTPAALLHRALTEVPDYSFASRGFMGGVPPLSSMRGLPSYEEASRCISRNDLHPLDPRHENLVEEPESMTSDERTRSGRLNARETVSDTDLVARFARAGVDTGIMQRLGSTESERSSSSSGSAEDED